MVLKRKKRDVEQKVSQGIYVRIWKSGQKVLRIQFCYHRKLCRETLRLEPTEENIQYAKQLRQTILEVIAKHTFNYCNFFLDSKRAAHFGHAPERIFIQTLLDQFLEKAKYKYEFSTYHRHKRACQQHLYPQFGKMLVGDLTPYVLRQWILKLNYKMKTIMNILTPLRAILEEALIACYIEKNPFDNLEVSRLIPRSQKINTHEIDPFTFEEIKIILAAAEGQIKNIYQFAFFTGLRSSELIGLNWEDIDWDLGVIHVRRAQVADKEKGPKTKAGYRNVLLLPPALEALQNQKQFTFELHQRVFHNPNTHRPWPSAERLRGSAWKSIFRKISIRYRNPYQTRHTYASMMISRGENIMWVSNQMGHETLQTTLKYYARLVPDSTIFSGYQPVNLWDNFLKKYRDFPAAFPQRENL